VQAGETLHQSFDHKQSGVFVIALSPADQSWFIRMAGLLHHVFQVLVRQTFAAAAASNPVQTLMLFNLLMPLLLVKILVSLEYGFKY
jgi:hypothetical protein